MVDKIKLVPISGANNFSNMNDNFVKLEKVINDNLLSRKVNSGEPNQMQTDLDMNNKRIYNLPPPQSPTEPLTAGYIGDLTDLVNTAQDNIAASQVLVDGANAANVEARQILEDTHLALDVSLGAIQTQTTNSLNQINSTSAVILADMTSKQQDVSSKAATVNTQANAVANQSAQVAIDAQAATAAASGASNSAATAKTAATQAAIDAGAANSARAQAIAASTAAAQSATNAAADAVTASDAADRAKAAASGTDTAYLLNRANHTGTQAMSTIVGLKTAATFDIGTTGAKVPLIGQENLWDVNQNFTSMNSGQLAGLRNRLLNSGFIINSRGSSFGIPNNGGRIKVQDCWMTYSENAGNMDMGIVFDTPAREHEVSVKFTTTSGNSNPSYSSTLTQGLDGQQARPLAGKKVTLSFWVKASKAGTTSCALVYWNTSNNPSTCIKRYTINAANTWEKKSVTFPAIPLDMINNLSTLTLQLSMHLSCSGDQAQTGEDTAFKAYAANQQGIKGSTAYIAGVAGNTIQFAGMQLESGEVATPYEHRSIGLDMLMCQRFLKVISVPGLTGVTFVSNGDTRCNVYTDSVLMRAQPTVTASPDSVGIITTGSNGSTVNTTHQATWVANSGGSSVRIQSLGGTAAVAGAGDVVAWGAQTNNIVTLSAEFF